MWWWILALIMVLLLGIAMFSDVRSRVKYWREGENDEVDVAVTALYGLVRLRYRVPSVQLKPMMRGLVLKISKRRSAGAEASVKNISKQEAERFLERAKELIRHMDDYKDWFAQTMRGVHISGLRWETRLGLGEAPETGIAAGIVWSVKNAVMALLSHWASVEEAPVLQVEPVFRGTAFETRFGIRTKVRLVRLLISVAMLAVRVLRSHGGWKVWGRIWGNVLLKRVTRIF